MERRLTLLLAGLLLGAPWAADDWRVTGAQPAGEGEVYVYLQPLPFDAEAVTFSIGTMSAADDQGAGRRLEVAFTTVAHPEARRQRLLGSGRLPEGQYTGLTIAVRNASLRRDGAEAALLVPDEPVRVDVPFLVTRGRAVVLWLEFRAADSLAPGTVDFTPVFTAFQASRPMLSLAGFVSSSTSNAVTVFDKKRRQVAAVVPTGSRPAGMALDQRAGRLYVACPDEDEILAIDVASAEIVERTRLFPGDGPREIALTPDGRTLVSVNPGSNSVSVFDASPLTRLDRVGVDSGPGALAIDPAGQRAFVFNALSGSVSVVDLAQRRVVTTISMDSAPLRGQFSARGDRLFVIHERSPYLTVVDPAGLAVVRRERLRTSGSAIRVDARRGWISIGSPGSTTVEFYEPNTLLPVDAMTVEGGVAHMTIDAEDNSMFLVSPGTGRLLVASVADRKVATEIDVGRGPSWVVVMGEK